MSDLTDCGSGAFLVLVCKAIGASESEFAHLHGRDLSSCACEELDSSDGEGRAWEKTGDGEEEVEGVGYLILSMRFEEEREAVGEGWGDEEREGTSSISM
jgi:hypothetical protein